MVVLKKELQHLLSGLLSSVPNDLLTQTPTMSSSLRGCSIIISDAAAPLLYKQISAYERRMWRQGTRFRYRKHYSLHLSSVCNNDQSRLSRVCLHVGKQSVSQNWQLAIV